MRDDPRLVFQKALLVTSSFLFSAFFFFSFQGSAYAVLKAEGGKEVVVADPIKDKGVKKETASSLGFTSRIPRSTRASADAGSQQPAALPAQSGAESFSQSRPINYQSSVAANAQPIVITATMKPTTVSPPLQSISEPAKPVSQSAKTASSQSPPDVSVTKNFAGCILGGTLVKDITLDVCNSKGGKPLMTGGASAAPASSVPQSAPPPTPKS